MNITKIISLILVYTLTILTQTIMGSSADECTEGCIRCSSYQGFKFCSACYNRQNIQGMCLDFSRVYNNKCSTFDTNNQCVSCTSGNTLSISEKLCYPSTIINCTRMQFNPQTQTSLCISCNGGVPNRFGKICVSFPKTGSFSNCQEGTKFIGPDGIVHMICTKCKPGFTVVYNGPLSPSCVDSSKQGQFNGCLIYQNNTKQCTFCDAQNSFYMLNSTGNCYYLPMKDDKINKRFNREYREDNNLDYEEINTNTKFEE